jgi:hypothetical protein
MICALEAARAEAIAKDVHSADVVLSIPAASAIRAAFHDHDAD